MPVDVFEDVHFDIAAGTEKICLSAYQSQLNELYKITSPVIEIMYGMRTSNDQQLRSMLSGMIAQVSHLMCEWQNGLPRHLTLDHVGDILPAASTAEKMHMLQALSLQLTYDNLMITIHRPVLSDQRASHAKSPEEGGQSEKMAGEASTEQHFSGSSEDPNFKKSLDSALRVSRVQDRPELVKHAAESHLVAFLGLNLFTSSVVMSVCALSDPLSDTAQEAKRGITRTLLVQKSLSNRTALSMQSGVILEDIVQLILEREREEMLRSVQSGMNGCQSSALHHDHSQPVHETPASVYCGSNIGTPPDLFPAQPGTSAPMSAVEPGDQELNNSLINLERSK